MERVRPRAEILQVLRGKVSEPLSTISKKPQTLDREVLVRLVREGSAMAGLGDADDNREWAGIFNHIFKVAGAAVTIGKLLKLNGQQVNVQLLLDTVIPSHSARRQYDEAVWYPDIVENSEEKKKRGDTRLTLAYLRQLGFDQNLIKHVSQHAIGDTLPFEEATTWNLKLPIFLDYRITQDAVSLDQRFADLHRQVPQRISQEYWESIYEWARQTERELFEALHLDSFEALMQNPAHLRARLDLAVKLGKFFQYRVDHLRSTAIYQGRRQRDFSENQLSMMRFMEFEARLQSLELKQEEFLAKLQLAPSDISHNLLLPGRWERYLRRLYLNDAEHSIFERYQQLQAQFQAAIGAGDLGGENRVREQFETEFPTNTWWGIAVRSLVIDDKKPYSPAHGKPTGIERAVKFFAGLEEKETVRTAARQKSS